MKKPITLSEIRPFVRLCRRFSLSRGSGYPAVALYDVRLIFCTEGSGVVQTEERTYTLCRGDLLLLPPGCAYSFRAPERDGTYLITNFDYTQEGAHLTEPIPAAFPREFDKSKEICPVLFTDEPDLNAPLFLSDMHKLTDPLLRLMAILSRKVIYYEREASALLVTVLLECLRTARLGALSRGRAAFGAVLDYLHEHYAEHLSNGTVAEALGYHPNYVNELVRHATGLSLHRYLTAIRIRHAIELLEEGESTVGEIALFCGFGDIYHFSRVFKSVTGVAPTRYRQRGQD